MNPVERWRRRRTMRRVVGEFRAHWDNLPHDLAHDLDRAGWHLVYITRHGIRCWADPDGEVHHYGAEFATDAQIQYAVDLLKGKAPKSPDGEMPDDALRFLLDLDALTILGGTPNVRE